MTTEEKIIEVLANGTKEEQDSMLMLIELLCGIDQRNGWEQVLSTTGKKKF